VNSSVRLHHQRVGDKFYFGILGMSGHSEGFMIFPPLALSESRETVLVEMRNLPRGSPVRLHQERGQSEILRCATSSTSRKQKKEAAQKRLPLLESTGKLLG
jgi:hypothetical protein